jgi:phosphoribosyl 1,2-cyclic phosphodiesterase
MSLFIASINSGSNGNCYYVGNENEAILVDAGISCREIEKRMRALELDLLKVKAIFVSHEHTDHISGIAVLSKKWNIPVYVTENTKPFCYLSSEHTAIPFTTDSVISIGELNITSFSKFHDAVHPHSFVVEHNNVRVGVFTDIGRPCKNLIKHFATCNAVFLESNYDTEMLMNGNYPYHLKKRISNGLGHLSNDEALDVFIKHRSPALSHLILSHLSKNNNDPAIVERLFSPHAEHTHVTVASRYAPSEVYRIEATGIPAETMMKRKRLMPKHEQLKLF